MIHFYHFQSQAIKAIENAGYAIDDCDKTSMDDRCDYVAEDDFIGKLQWSGEVSAYETPDGDIYAYWDDEDGYAEYLEARLSDDGAMFDFGTSYPLLTWGGERENVNCDYLYGDEINDNYEFSSVKRFADLDDWQKSYILEQTKAEDSEAIKEGFAYVGDDVIAVLYANL